MYFFKFCIEVDRNLFFFQLQIVLDILSRVDVECSRIATKFWLHIRLSSNYRKKKMDNVDAKNTKKSKEVAKDVLKELFHFHLSHTIALRSLSDILIFLDITKNLTNSCL